MASAFAERYGAPPTHWTRAPGRIDLMGTHTDHNQGWALTMSIDRDTWAAGRLNPATGVHTLDVQSLNRPGVYSFDLDRLERLDTPNWPNYLGGMAWVLAESGYSVPPAQVIVDSALPIGSGLASSAALEIATSTLLEALGNIRLDPLRRALLAQRAENHFAAADCGISDHYSVSAGRAGHIIVFDSRSLHAFNLQMADGLQVMICDTKAPRRLFKAAWGARCRHCDEVTQLLRVKLPGIKSLRDVQRAMLEAVEAEIPPDLARFARFVVEESARVLTMAEALEMGDRPAIRKLMCASYRGARQLYGNGVPEMNAMMHAACQAPGAIGIRQTGVGFSGCMVAVIEQEATDAFVRSTSEHYYANTGIVPDIFPVQPAEGAGLLEH
jgi:galactokinase